MLRASILFCLQYSNKSIPSRPESLLFSPLIFKVAMLHVFFDLAAECVSSPECRPLFTLRRIACRNLESFRPVLSVKSQRFRKFQHCLLPQILYHRSRMPPARRGSVLQVRKGEENREIQKRRWDSQRINTPRVITDLLSSAAF